MYIELRKAKPEDSEKLLEWKNDQTVRDFSIATKEEVSEKTHKRWFMRKMHSIYIISENGVDCGDIRFDKDFIAIKLDPKFRGQGIGGRALEIAILLKDEIFAKVVDGNVASMNLFIAAGFKVIDHKVENDTGYYILRYRR